MYETHITIDPVTNPGSMEDLVFIAGQHGFKVAELLMKKEGGETVPSTIDSFLTGHEKSFIDAELNLQAMCLCLRNAGFKIRRYKIESIIVDSKYQADPWGLLMSAIPL